jgi:hypothetical protein
MLRPVLSAGFVGVSLFRMTYGKSECKGSHDNSAFVFIKPHANTPAVQALMKKKLADKGIVIDKEGELTGEQIDKGMLIDTHYYAIASKATLLKPSQLPVNNDKFQAAFGKSWSEVLKSGQAYNAIDACKYLGVDAEGLDKLWGEAAKAKKLVKLGGGFYCGLIPGPAGKDPIYVFNGFFMSMRSKFVMPKTSIHYFVVSFPSEKLKWEEFRGSVLGPTNPSDAPSDSARGMIYADWKNLGLAAVPNTGDNGVHASASPFEGLAERMNWLKVVPQEDEFGSELLAAGLAEETIQKWSLDPQVKGKSLFDSLEDMDSLDCINKAVELNK